MMSVTWHNNLAQGREAFAINPYKCSAYPNTTHALHLWSILQNNEYLFDNARRIAEMAIPPEEKEGENAWVGQGARRWSTRILILLTLLEGRATPKSFWRLVNAIDADDGALKSWGERAEGLPYEVYSTLVEIFNKKHGSEKEYGAIMGKLKDDCDFLSSETIADAISGEGDFLSYLADRNRKVGIYYALPGGSGKFNRSLTRMVVGIAQLHCIRANNGHRPLFYLSEAATCGNAEFIKSAVSEFRKYFRTVLEYQSHGQLTGLFGKSGAQEILDSCGLQLYLGGGIRDIDSARRIADSIGKATIHIDDPITQGDRAYKAYEASLEGLQGDGDPEVASRVYQHEIAQSEQQRQVGRYALDPAELMRLQDEMLVLAPGYGIQPVLAHKLPPYWQHPEMAGKYGPDPLFPPGDKVVIQRRWRGQVTRQFHRIPVPEGLADWSNHMDGMLAFVEGYPTWPQARSRFNLKRIFL